MTDLETQVKRALNLAEKDTPGFHDSAFVKALCEDWLTLNDGSKGIAHESRIESENLQLRAQVEQMRAVMEKIADDSWFSNGFVPAADEQTRHCILMDRVNEVRRITDQALREMNEEHPYDMACACDRCQKRYSEVHEKALG